MHIIMNNTCFCLFLHSSWSSKLQRRIIHLPRMQRSSIYPTHTQKAPTRHRGARAEQKWSVKAKTAADICGTKEEDRSNCCSNILLSYSSDARVSSPSHSLCFICLLSARLPAGLFAGALGNAWSLAPQTRITSSSRSFVPTSAESRPQPAKNPPFLLRRPPRLRGPSPACLTTAETNSWIVMPLSVTTPKGAWKD